MFSDKLLSYILISFSLCIAMGMVFKGLMYWWIPLLIMFLFLALYYEAEAEKDAEDAYNKFMRSDYYDSYESDDNDYVDIEKQLDITKCSQCGNKVYEICMCKPVKRRKKQ